MSRSSDDLREGERPFPREDAISDDAVLRFVGRVRSPWIERSQCPKNVRDARVRGLGAAVHIDERYREALRDLSVGDWILLLTWLDQARRDLAHQRPRHAAEPRGTFSLRSPVRPNPIGLHLVRITALDETAGRIGIDAVDVIDGTPLLDIKPYLASVDAPPAGGSRDGD